MEDSGVYYPKMGKISRQDRSSLFLYNSLKKLTVKELKRLARKYKLRNYSYLSKDKIIRFLLENVEGSVLEQEFTTVKNLPDAGYIDKQRKSKSNSQTIQKSTKYDIQYKNLPVIVVPIKRWTDYPVELVNLIRQMDVPTLLNFCRTSREIRQLCQQLPDIQYRIEKAKVLKTGLIFIGAGGEDLRLRLRPDEAPMKVLSLTRRSIAIVPDDIKYLDELSGIVLSFNNIVELPPSIGQLTNLVNLNLENNQLVALPSSIGQLTNLANLNLENNQLVALPDEIGDLRELLILKVNRNRLTELPDTIGNLTNLIELAASRNRLSNLPPSLENVPLRELILYSNRFTRFPDIIPKIGSLTLLSLWNNQLTKIPTDIGNLVNLDHLFLGRNRLTSLPSSIGNLRLLLFLNLEHNMITFLPPSITQLINLRKLELEFNEIAQLPSAFGQLTSLRYLNLKHNELFYLPSTFTNLDNLTVLILEENPHLILDDDITAFLRVVEARPRSYVRV